MNWTLLVTKPAQKDLEKLPSRDQVRIERALDSLQIDPFSGDIKRLQATWLAQAYWQLSNFLRSVHRRAANRCHRYQTPHFHHLLKSSERASYLRFGWT